jgi:hypothetical protein
VIGDFDVSPDGTEIVFDRAEERSSVPESFAAGVGRENPSIRRSVAASFLSRIDSKCRHKSANADILRQERHEPTL